MAVALVSRMPVGMGAFSMLMFLREHLGSYALAGSAVGAFFVAMAVAAPAQGRLIDRMGPRIPLWVTGIAQPIAYGALLHAGISGASYAWVTLAAAAVGALAPPITVLTRTLWRHRFERDDDRRMAFSLDAVMIEINFTAGPAIVALILATAGATAAFCVTIATCIVAFAIFMASPALTYFKREPPAERHLLGPLTEPRLLLLFTATFGLTLCFGLLEVGYPAYGTGLAVPALGGVLLAVSSLGSAVGGAIYGGLRLALPVERQFAATLGLMAVPLFLHAIVDPPVLFGLVAFLAGALIAPSIASQSVLTSRLAPAKYATEAFTWSSTFIVSGLGAGMALGGTLVETAGVKAAFATAGAIVCAMALLALLLPVKRA